MAEFDVDEDRLQKNQSQRKSQEEIFRHAEEKTVFKTKMILLAVWVAIIIVLSVLSAVTSGNVGFSPYQFVLIPVASFGAVMIIKEINSFFRNN